jgi:hypothetical protein
MTVQSFLEEWHHAQRSGRSILTRESVNERRDYANTLSDVWHLSFSYLETKRASAADLLGFLSFFHPDRIPQQLLLAWYRDIREKTHRKNNRIDAHTPDGGELRNLQSIDDHKAVEELDADIAELIIMCLTKQKFTRTGPILSMHRLVQFEQRRRLDMNRQTERLRSQFLALLDKVLSSNVYMAAFDFMDLLPHVVAAFDLKCKDRKSRLLQASLLRNAGISAVVAGYETTAEKMQVRSVMIRKACLGLEDALTVESMESLMRTYTALERADLAEKLRIEMVEIEQKQHDSGYGSDESAGSDQEDLVLLATFEEQDYLLKSSGAQTEPLQNHRRQPKI